MYNRATEIADLVNLMLLNEGLPLLPSVSSLFDNLDRLTEDGVRSLSSALKGRVSFVPDMADASAYPVLIWPTKSGIKDALEGRTDLTPRCICERIFDTRRPKAHRQEPIQDILHKDVSLPRGGLQADEDISAMRESDNINYGPDVSSKGRMRSS